MSDMASRPQKAAAIKTPRRPFLNKLFREGKVSNSAFAGGPDPVCQRQLTWESQARKATQHHARQFSPRKLLSGSMRLEALLGRTQPLQTDRSESGGCVPLPFVVFPRFQWSAIILFGDANTEVGKISLPRSFGLQEGALEKLWRLAFFRSCAVCRVELPDLLGAHDELMAENLHLRRENEVQGEIAFVLRRGLHCSEELQALRARPTSPQQVSPGTRSGYAQSLEPVLLRDCYCRLDFQGKPYQVTSDRGPVPWAISHGRQCRTPGVAIRSHAKPICFRGPFWVSRAFGQLGAKTRRTPKSLTAQRLSRTRREALEDHCPAASTQVPVNISVDDEEEAEIPEDRHLQHLFFRLYGLWNSRFLEGRLTDQALLLERPGARGARTRTQERHERAGS